jgi:hypothetical protein
MSSGMRRNPGMGEDAGEEQLSVAHFVFWQQNLTRNPESG